MQDKLFRKCLVIGIIVLFVGAGVIPSISGNIEKINNLPSEEENDEIGMYALDSDLVGWWSFDEGSGHIANDYSGNGNDGTIYGATWTIDTPSGERYALSFDGIDDYVDILDTSDFEFTNQDLTFSAWVTLINNADKYRQFVSLGDYTDGYPHINLAKPRSSYWNGRIFFEIIHHPDQGLSYARSILDGGNLPKGVWIYLTGVVDYPNSLKLYLNAALQETDDLISFDVSDADVLKLVFGKNACPFTGWPGYHYGLIDEVRIYNKALSESEIEYLYNNPGNQPPNKPSKPSGRTHGRVGVEYTYTTSTTDLEGIQVYYMWDWGDGSFSDWLGPYDSGLTVSASHSWSKGSYNIRVKAKDDAYSAESNWSDSLIVTMPRNRATSNVLFYRFLEQFPILQKILLYLIK